MNTGLAPSQYQEYMRSPAWERRKAWWRSLNQSQRRRRCRACGERRYDLHHRTYVRLGCERVRDLVPLCHRHHEALHDLQRRFGWSVEKASRRFLLASYARQAGVFAAVAAVGVSLLLLYLR